MNSRHKRRRPERPDDPTGPLNARLPGSLLKFLQASEWSVSSRLAEAVELLMKQEGYVVPAEPLPVGVRPLPDAVAYATLKDDASKFEYLRRHDFSNVDICVYLRCNRRYLARLVKQEEEAEERKTDEIEAEFRREIGTGPEVTAAALLALCPSSRDEMAGWRATILKARRNGTLEADRSYQLEREFSRKFLLEWDGVTMRRTRAGDAEVAKNHEIEL